MMSQSIDGGRVVSFRFAGDNHEPTRDVGHGYGVRYTRDDGYEAMWIAADAEHALSLAELRKSNVIVDDGQSVTVMYLAGYRGELDADNPAAAIGVNYPYALFHAFPLSRGTRPDNGRPVDMSNWMLGPRKSYHLKVSDVRGESDLVTYHGLQMTRLAAQLAAERDARKA